MTAPRTTSSVRVDERTGPPACELREIDEQFLSELQRYDGADDLELGDHSVQADQLSSVG